MVYNGGQRQREEVSLRDSRPCLGHHGGSAEPTRGGGQDESEEEGPG